VVSTKLKSNSLYRFIEKYWAWFFAIVLLLSVLVRFITLTKSSIWHDEGFSVMLSGRGWLDIWAGSARDVHPPLYYELLHGWTSIFGKSVSSIRSMSMVAGVVIVALGYKVVFVISKKRNVALLAAIILALNPFLIRYSQEARMYGVLGVFLLLAIVGLIKIVQNNRNWLGYVLYVFGVSAGLYTHYFTALAVISFWVYLLFIFFYKSKNRLIIDWRWWLANALALTIFLPWIPNMFKQLTRAQGLGWLSKTSIKTFNDTIWQFFTFTDARQIWQVIYWLIPIILLVLILYVCIKDKTKEKLSILVVLFAVLPIALAIIASLVKPVFHERYFAFSAIGICMLLALALSYLYNRHKYIGILTAIIVLLIQLIGIRNVYAQSNHQMSRVMGFVDSNYRGNDTLIAGELYVYFDGSYYNSTGKNFLLYTGGGRPNGYGESGLIYNKNVYLDNYDQVSSGRVWIIGKTGQHSYYDNVPSSWKLLETESAGYSEARLYQIQ